MTIETVHCGDLLIHPEHEWPSHEQPDPVEDPEFWAPVEYRCEGNADQDDPLFRFECCAHCGPASCPRRDGHVDACLTPGCPGRRMLGEPLAA